MYKYIYFKLIKFLKRQISFKALREAVEMTESALVYICLNK